MNGREEPIPGEIDRRGFLGGVALAALPLASTAADTTGASPATAGSHPGLVVREKDPLNLEFPFPTLDTAITPTNRFFVRTHFGVPKLTAPWRLRVDGEVEKELELTLDDLRKLPSKTLPALIECAGNGRAFLVPKAKGLAWESGAVGTPSGPGCRCRPFWKGRGSRPGRWRWSCKGRTRGKSGTSRNPPV